MTSQRDRDHLLAALDALRAEDRRVDELVTERATNPKARLGYLLARKADVTQAMALIGRHL